MKITNLDSAISCWRHLITAHCTAVLMALANVSPALAQPLAFQRAAVAEFDTRTAAAAAFVNGSTQRLNTRGFASAGDGGGASYVSVTCPGSITVDYIQTSNSRCFRLDQFSVPFEAFGVVSGAAAATSANDAALQAIATALADTSLRVYGVHAKPGASYKWGADTQLNGFTALLLDGVVGKTFEFNNSLWQAQLASNKRFSFADFRGGASFNKIRGLRGEQTLLARSSSFGIDWFGTRTGASYNEFDGIFDGGLQGYSATAFAGADAPVRGNRVNLVGKNVAYPLANQGAGEGEFYKVRCDGNFRCVIAYNTRGNVYDATLVSTTALPLSNQFLFKAYGQPAPGASQPYSDFTGHDITIRFDASTWQATPTSPLVDVQHDQWDYGTAGDYGSKIEFTLRLDADLGAGSFRPQQIFQNESLIFTTNGAAGSLTRGEPGDGGVNEEHIVITGQLRGNLAGSSDAFTVNAAAQGWGPNGKPRIAFENLSMRSLTRPLTIGQYGDVVLRNVDAPGMAVTLASARAGLTSISDSTTATFAGAFLQQPDNSKMSLIIDTGGTNQIRLRRAGVDRADVISDDVSLYLRGPSSVWIGPQGAAGATTNYFQFSNTALTPSLANTIDIGSSSARFATLFAQNLNISGACTGCGSTGGSFSRSQYSFNATLASSDAGNLLQNTGAGLVILTVPTNASVPIPVGSLFLIDNNNGAGSFTNITRASGVIMWRSTDNADGNVTVNARGLAYLLKVDTDVWRVWGFNLTSS